nr:hypothetical protein [Tanacetum cinerariifolium]
QQHPANNQVGQLHGAHVDGGGRGGVAKLRQAAQDESAAQQRGQRGAQRVEGLRERKARRGRLGRPQDGHVGVGRHLQQRDARGQHKQRPQKQPVGPLRGGRIKQEGAHGRHHKAQQHALFVAQARHQLAGRNTHQKVRPEKAQVNQVGLRKGQLKNGLQIGNQNVVETRDEAPQKEQGSNGGQRRGVARGGAGGGRGSSRPAEGGSRSSHSKNKQVMW